MRIIRASSCRALFAAIFLITLTLAGGAKPDRSPIGNENSAAAGTTIRWRTDYNSARVEAQEKKLGLVLLFLPTNSIFCERVESDISTLDSVAARRENCGVVEK